MQPHLPSAPAQPAARRPIPYQRAPQRRSVADPVLPAGWRLYRAYGELPEDAPVRYHLIELFLGRQLWLLYVGISGRPAPMRWSEHLDGSARYDAPPKAWAPRVVLLERDPRIFATEQDARDAERQVVRRENPFENTEHALPGSDKRPRSRRTYRPTRFRIVMAKAGALLLAWLALIWLPWRIITTQWLDWGPATWTSGGVAAVVLLVVRLWASQAQRI